MSYSQISTLTNEDSNNESRKHAIQIIKNSLDDFQFNFNGAGLRVEIIKGDLTEQTASVIVNSANNALQLSCELK